MRFLKSILTCGVSLALLSTQAQALSCMAPDLAKTMEEAKQSETLYYILVGTLSSDKPIEHRGVDIENQFQERPPELTRVTFTGHSLAQRKQWDVPLRNFTVDVETRCFGPWCSNVPLTNETQIMFVEANLGGVPTLRVSPCPDNVFYADRDGNNVRKLRACFDKECISDIPEFR